ncbi:MAG: hypothetical protein Q7R78_02025 [bacterium]|nr:hypothetical protein [bacterium]
MQNTDSTSAMIMVCPHCQKTVEIRAFLKPSTVAVKPEMPGALRDPLQDLTPDQLKMVVTAKENGIMEKFRECVEFVKQGQTPKSMERFFVTVLKTSQVKTVPRSALAVFDNLSDHGEVQYFTSQGVGIVIANGSIRAFVPNSLVFGSSVKIKARGGGIKTLSPYDETTLTDWFDAKRFFSLGQRLSFADIKTKSYGGK